MNVTVVLDFKADILPFLDDATFFSHILSYVIPIWYLQSIRTNQSIMVSTTF